jgi:hypothetical protein
MAGAIRPSSTVPAHPSTRGRPSTARVLPFTTGLAIIGRPRNALAAIAAPNAAADRLDREVSRRALSLVVAPLADAL